jgi:molybdate transport system substrate-binding protein
MNGARIFCTTAFKVILDELASEFERRSGRQLLPTYGAAPRLIEMLLAGEPSEAALFSGDAIDTLIAKGGAHQDSRVNIGRAEIAVAVPAGAPHPDISTAESLERALLAAGSVALSNPAGQGFSALHMQSVLERLGLTDRLKSKIVYSAGGPTGMVGFLLATGQADIGIQLKPELMTVTGIQIVGPLPPPLAGSATFVLARTTQATSSVTTDLLAELLRTSGAEVMRGRGFDPA